ncbi:bifunctional molybdopterin-guanine dinucleotide biosynthesis adaptor protein MobB/molybdopterin molybdotransferase MoeA [Sneathiella glossodoripedis]|uniref:bifunctional molybdopterin-guanine dinucleotide biosynthesis adaptor protein MobB/molybdopterin molybdotransferase MoeA n=1 Tax=Sneathiella glossodoripedis TaxID=418853 RepID=UPI000472FD2E|nr:bifunctional molybdopterin-guanine dinucleotide biosynthesis adaptor protein MobB/molybdopterin molybdotransferase MoeA [Sneathiella glossodoripedis]
MKILGISGWSGSGKTTLLVSLIPKLIERGYSVSTLKHAHHRFDIDKPGKDSFRHRQAGAKEVLVSSRHRWAHMHENTAEDEASFDELCRRFSPVDILLVEGFKSEDFPKLEVWRGLEGATPLFMTDETVIGVITNQKDLDTRLPLIDIDAIDDVADFIEAHLFPAQGKSAPTKISNDCFRAPEDMISTEEARKRILQNATAFTETETVAISAATGRITSQDIYSNISLPPADNSAVDGFAFAAQDLNEPPNRALQIVGRSAAGQPFDRTVHRGECVRIFTGALIPEGCDTVAMIEDCTVKGDEVVINASLRPGSNRRCAAEDIRQGEIAVRAGTTLHPPHIARLASVGAGRVNVFRPLRIAILSTGDELLEPGETHQSGKIYDANRYMLRSCFEKHGWDVQDFGILPDSKENIQRAVEVAASSCDFVISSGGVSLGDEDHVKAVIEELGHIDFWRIAIKPGRPLALGMIKDVPFMGLPGNPVAALVCALQFALPLAKRLAGSQEEVSIPYYLIPSAFEMKKKSGRKEWLRGRYSHTATGDLRVEKFRSEGSGLIESLTWANGLIELDEQTTEVSVGEPVKFIPFSEFYP